MKARSPFTTCICSIVLLISLLAGCGGGDEGGTSTQSDGTTPNLNPATPLFPGFEFTLKQGDFYEVSWDSTTNFSPKKSGSYCFTLGAAQTIGETSMYPIQVSAVTGDIGFQPRWKFLGVGGNKVYGSNGTSLTVLFDGITGKFAGSGFFREYAPDRLMVANRSQINNAYIVSDAYEVGYSHNESQCEIILGVRICGNNSASINDVEYYKREIGPVGHRLVFAAENCGGGFCTITNIKDNVGVTNSSRFPGNQKSSCSQTSPLPTTNTFFPSGQNGEPPALICGVIPAGADGKLCSANRFTNNTSIFLDNLVPGNFSSILTAPMTGSGYTIVLTTRLAILSGIGVLTPKSFRAQIILIKGNAETVLFTVPTQTVSSNVAQTRTLTGPGATANGVVGDKLTLRLTCLDGCTATNVIALDIVPGGASARIIVPATAVQE